VVRSERRPTKWNCAVAECRRVIRNADPERHCHLHCDGNRLDDPWCANSDRKFQPNCRIMNDVLF
jgi:hypothetical protein